MIETTKVQAKEAAPRLRFLQPVQFSRSNKYSDAITTYFQEKSGMLVTEVCAAFLRKMTGLTMEEARDIEFMEKMNEKWHSAVGYPPTQWKKDITTCILVEWWILFEIVAQCNICGNTLFALGKVNIEQ